MRIHNAHPFCLMVLPQRLCSDSPFHTGASLTPREFHNPLKSSSSLPDLQRIGRHSHILVFLRCASVLYISMLHSFKIFIIYLCYSDIQANGIFVLLGTSITLGPSWAVWQPVMGVVRAWLVLRCQMDPLSAEDTY